MSKRRKPPSWSVRRGLEGEPGRGGIPTHDADALRKLFPESDGDLLIVGFDCNQCENNRTVAIHITTGKAGDFETGTRPDKGAPISGFQIICLPDLTKQDILKTVADAHSMMFHPEIPTDPLIINAVGSPKSTTLRFN